MQSIKISLLALTALLFFSCAKERFINEPGNLVPKTVDQDPGLPAITVNGVMLHSEAFGNPDSTMIVCLHGGPGGDYRYLLNCRQLADQGYRVIFYDQRGSGLSQRFPENSYSSIGLRALDVMYDELSGVITHYRTRPDQKVYLLGHSWGAILATAYAGKYPDAIQGLVLCEPGGLKWEDIEEYISESRSFDIWSELLNDATYMDQFLSSKEDQHEILDYKYGLLASRNEITGEDNSAPGSKWRSGAVINASMLDLGEEYKPDFSAGINNYHVPVLFFYSEKNKAYSDTWAVKISGAFNSVERTKVSGVGHDGIISDQKAWSQITLPRILTYFNSL
jgi:proline iminopeptidase